MLLLHEFDLEIKIQKRSENLAVDHLSCLQDTTKEANSEDIEDAFPDEQLFMVEVILRILWFSDFTKFLTAGYLRKDFTYQQRKKFHS